MFESLRLFNSDMDPHWLYVLREVTVSFHFACEIFLDFLATHQLLVDPAQPAVIHRPSGRLLPLSPPLATTPTLHSLPDLFSPLQHLLHSFPTVFSSDLHNLSPHHGVQHHIHTTGPPVFTNARRLDPLRLQLGYYS